MLKSNHTVLRPGEVFPPMHLAGAEVTAGDDNSERGEASFRYLVENIAEGVCIIDRDNNTILFANQQMSALLGCLVSEVVGTSLFDWMDAEGVRITVEQLERRIRGTGDRYDQKLHGKDGRIVWATVSATPLYDVMGQSAASWLFVVTDITERLRAEKLHAFAVLLRDDALLATDSSRLFQRVHAVVGEVIPADHFLVARLLPSKNQIEYPYQAGDPPLDLPPHRGGMD